MRMTSAQVALHEARIAHGRAKSDHFEDAEPVDLESKLHQQIRDFCDTRWPRWKFIRCRMDKKSTIAKGAQDFTIFGPEGKTILIECKARNEKPDDDQLAWHKELEMAGHHVHTVWSFDGFLSVLRDLNL